MIFLIYTFFTFIKAKKKNHIPHFFFQSQSILQKKKKKFFFVAFPLTAKKIIKIIIIPTLGNFFMKHEVFPSSPSAQDATKNMQSSPGQSILWARITAIRFLFCTWTIFTLASVCRMTATFLHTHSMTFLCVHKIAILENITLAKLVLPAKSTEVFLPFYKRINVLFKQKR